MRPVWIALLAALVVSCVIWLLSERQFKNFHSATDVGPSWLVCEDDSRPSHCITIPNPLPKTMRR